MSKKPTASNYSDTMSDMDKMACVKFFKDKRDIGNVGVNDMTSVVKTVLVPGLKWRLHGKITVQCMKNGMILKGQAIDFTYKMNGVNEPIILA